MTTAPQIGDHGWPRFISVMLLSILLVALFFYASGAINAALQTHTGGVEDGYICGIHCNTGTAPPGQSAVVVSAMVVFSFVVVGLRRWRADGQE